MADTGRGKYVTLHSRRQEIRKRYGREPDAFEERALAELPLTQDGKIKEVYDDSRNGSRIRELLLDSETHRDVGPLHEAGELLFMHAYKNPNAVEQGGIAEERARFMVGSESHPIRSLSATALVTIWTDGDGARPVAISSPYPERLPSMVSYPTSYNANNYMTVGGKRAKFKAEVESRPEALLSEPSYAARIPYATDQAPQYLARNPYATQDIASEALNAMPVGPSYSRQRASNSSQHQAGPSVHMQSLPNNRQATEAQRTPKCPLSPPLQLAPLGRILPGYDTGPPIQSSGATNNHGGWQQFQPQQAHPTTDPRAHCLSRPANSVRPANFDDLPVLPHHSSGIPASLYLNAPSSAVPPIADVNCNRPLVYNSHDVPSARHNISSNSLNARRNEGSNRHVFYSAAVPSVTQPHANLPAMASSSVCVPYPHDSAGQTSHRQPIGTEPQDREKHNGSETTRPSRPAVSNHVHSESSSTGGTKRNIDQFVEGESEQAVEGLETALPERSKNG